MARNEYRPRIADKLLQMELLSAGAVLVEGAKWCGKTRTAEQVAHSIVYMQDQDMADNYLQMAETMPSMLLEGDEPHLIDEWQVAPNLWDAVRFAVDKRGGMGHFVLTGSAVPPDDDSEENPKLKRRHTGTGRITRLLMRPMSLWESGDSNGKVSLGDLFDGKVFAPASCELSIPDIARLICRGGWPESIFLSGNPALRIARNYVKAIVEEDVHRVDGVERNPERVMCLLKSLARNVSSVATQQTIIDDMCANDCTASDKTVADYLNALRRIFVIEDTPAWAPTLRSRTAVRTAAKRQFSDPSIPAAVLGVNPDGLMRDIITMGFLFESMCCRDLRVYAQTMDGKVAHFRDRYGLEIDLVVSLPDGKWGGVEVKLGSGRIDEAASNLTKIARRIDEERMGKPSFLMVLTGTKFAFRRPDGVYVVPLGCLRP
ncbi:MAG: ATP-binding protein [Kiritimatiellae bacterium]|nr:ATP-binding protein [Kiritimatiellia bacterium]